MVGGPSLARNVPETEDETQPTKAARHSGRLLVRMPAELHDELAQAAEHEGVSLNQYITSALADAVDWEGAEPSRGGGRGFRRTIPSRRVTWAALAVNLAVVLVAAVAAIALLVIAWQQA
jgi:hypothetical protein